ncbi:zinc ABC transporter permease AztB [Mycolicibacterium tokaiense]|uniref:ABC-3 protein n=1 Tax=Mycolicibacterium tokaiense TaxID=39695 RepID=A0A378TEA9_9MYCO|nr:zinc ABC transporter permease AztB [Mycolicibacterium tokaiense]BBY86403.1 hypothetical protein MTOK_21850 [Mycolicibacterium tokaiense]STZ59089.1 ABC-3 protein [Mycolicibacterium tokaiense]
MLGLLTEPFSSALVRQALVAGLIATAICAIVGTWVVLRGSAFLGDAMSHGVLPGVALASLLGGNIVVGALMAALAMAYGVSALGTSTRLSPDTTIGLLLVGMLALGVIVVSHSRSFATDLTALLFGDVLAATNSDIIGLAVALVVIAMTAFLGRRAFIAATFDSRKAATLGLRPTVALATLTVLMALAIVASFQVVGTLLMLGLLVAPPAAAILWARSVPQIMLGAAVIGAISVIVGLVISWHAATAGGATIAITAVALFFVSLAATALAPRVRKSSAAAATAIVAVVGLVGCSSPEQSPAPAPEGAEHNLDSAGTVELDGAPTRLIVVDSGTGAAEVLDALEETGAPLGEFGPMENLVGDGRFGYLLGRSGVAVVDSGAWTFDHGDHSHYYAKPPAALGDSNVGAVAVAADTDRVALRSADGNVVLWDREWLEDGEIRSMDGPPVEGARVAVPYQGVLVVATETGELLAVDDDGTAAPLPVRCEQAGGVATTRTAVVLACRDGAVRVSGDEDLPQAALIPFPAGQTPALPLLTNLGSEGTVVGLSGEQLWALDSSRAMWSSVEVPDAVAANSVGDGHALVLTRDGMLRTVTLADGNQVAELPLFAGGVSIDGPMPVIEVDRERAYVNNAAAQAIYEIDYRDGLRLARTLTTTVTPDLMVETGR